MPPRLTPELEVENLSATLTFYMDILGFDVLFQRAEEAFAYLTLGDVHFMFEEANGPGRRLHTAPLQYPFGRGVNFQIMVEDVEGLYQRIMQAGFNPLLPLETRWYRQENQEAGNRQFVIADPDGYLLRFYTDLGKRPAITL